MTNKCTCGNCKSCQKAVFVDELESYNRSLDTPAQMIERMRIESFRKVVM